MDLATNEAVVADDTRTQRVSDRELLVTRVFDAPARIVFEAWTNADLMKQWWVPKSFGITLLSCEIDARPGGTYKLVFANPETNEPMPFVGRYLEVVPPTRLSWTNEEGAEGPVTTVTFEERDGKTQLTLRDVYPSREALDEALASGSVSGYPEQFDALEDLLESLD